MTKQSTTDPEAKEIIETLFPKLLRSLTQFPDDLQVRFSHGRGSSSINVTPHRSDFGLILGTGGKTIGSLIVLAQAISVRHRWKVLFDEIEEPVIGEKLVHRPDIAANENWVSDPIVSLLKETVSAFCKERFTVIPLEGGKTTNLEVTVDHEELWPNDPKMETALSTIFNAIGHLQGRSVKVLYSRSPETSVRQPVENRGRYC